MTDTAPVFSNIVRLSRPLKTHAGEINEITVKEPLARHFLRAKNDPFKISFTDGGTEVSYDLPATFSVLADVTGIDSGILETLPARDFIALREKLVLVTTFGIGDANSPLQ